MLGTGLEHFVIRHVVDDAGLHALLPPLLLRLDPDRQADPSGRHAVITLYCEPGDPGLKPRRGLRARLVQGPRGLDTHVEIRHHVGRRRWELRAKATIEQVLAACRGEWLAGAPRLLQEAAALVRELGLEPRCLVAADRRAFVPPAPGHGHEEDRAADLRVTIDSRLRHREHDLVLRPDDDSTWSPLLPADQHLVEVQVARAVPSWLAHALERARATDVAPSRSEMVRQALAGEGQAGPESRAVAS